MRISRTSNLSAAALLVIVVILSGCSAAPVAAPVQDAPTPVAESVAASPTTAAAPVANQESRPVATQESAAPTDSPAAAAAMGGVITRALTSEPPVIDPQAAPHSGLSLLLPYLFDTLVVRDVNNEILPGLADKWEVAADGLAITMTLKSGVTFHSGAPLDAAAVKFTFERFKESGKASPIYGGVMQITEIEAPDPATVIFRFKAPAANFFSTITMPYAGIIDPGSASGQGSSKQGDSSATVLEGSGPFKLAEWKAGQSIELVRNEAYAWGAPNMQNTTAPLVERLLFKVIPDATTQLNALQTGEVDVIFVNNPGHKKKVEADDNVEVHEAVLNSLVYLGFNCAKAPFDDANVRQALSYAVNKDEILKVGLGGVGQVADAPLPPTLPGYDASIRDFSIGYEPARVDALLIAGGLTKGTNGEWLSGGEPFKPVLLTSTRAPNDTIATLLQAQLKAVGVELEIQQLDSKAVMQATTEGKFDLLLFRYDWNDPDALNIYLGTKRIGSTNRVAYSNPEVDALLDEGARELDPVKRIGLYVEAQKLILTDAPWQPLYYPVDVIAVARRVEGEKVGFMGRLLLNDATVAP